MVNINPERTLDTYAREYANDPEFIAEGLAIKITEEMLVCLEQKNRKQSWLAEQMGVSRANVSRILNARPNMTLLTISKIAVALGVKPDVCLDTEPWLLNIAKSVTAAMPEESVFKPNRIIDAVGEFGYRSPMIPEKVTA